MWVFLGFRFYHCIYRFGVFLLASSYRYEEKNCVESRSRPWKERSRSGVYQHNFPYSNFLQSEGLKILGSRNIHEGFWDKSEAR